jgi:CRISPR/Cas system-associated exonuclease Cas4 (RecB family)
LELQVAEERKARRELDDKLHRVASLRQEFERAVSFIHTAFVTIQNERTLELATYRRAKAEVEATKDAMKKAHREELLEVQLSLDAQAILAEELRQQMSLLQEHVHNLNSMNIALVQQNEKLKKGVLGVEHSATEANASPLTSPVDCGDQMMLPEHLPVAFPRQLSLVPVQQSPASLEPTGALKRTKSLREHLEMHLHEHRTLRTPRPDKREITDAVPELGHPQQFESTRSLIAALVNLYISKRKRHDELESSMGRLNDRLQEVVDARVSLLLRKQAAHSTREENHPNDQ